MARRLDPTLTDIFLGALGGTLGRRILSITDGGWIRIDSGAQPQALPPITGRLRENPPLYPFCNFLVRVNRTPTTSSRTVNKSKLNRVQGPLKKWGGWSTLPWGHLGAPGPLRTCGRVVTTRVLGSIGMVPMDPGLSPATQSGESPSAFCNSVLSFATVCGLLLQCAVFCYSVQTL
jgi:hypothetical protein